jgi:hypothetical protein
LIPIRIIIRMPNIDMFPGTKCNRETNKNVTNRIKMVMNVWQKKEKIKLHVAGGTQEGRVEYFDWKTSTNDNT